MTTRCPVCGRRDVAGTAQTVAFGAVDADQLGLDRHVDSARDRDRCSTDSRHHQTSATTSPPTPAARASWPVITPLEVDTIAVPCRPGRGGCAWRRRSAPARAARRAAGRRSPSAASRRSAGGSRGPRRAHRWPGRLVGVDVALLGEDPRKLGLELRGGHLDGLVGGVDRIAYARQEVGDGVGHRHGRWLLPGGLGHPGDLALVRDLAKADPADPELAIHRARPAAACATSIRTCFEFGGRAC